MLIYVAGDFSVSWLAHRLGQENHGSIPGTGKAVYNAQTGSAPAQPPV
jgi:hypothetical protein